MAHLTNPLVTPSQLFHRASFSALPQDLHEVIFIATQCLTQAAGLLLELPQSITAQANIILARYWIVDAPMKHEFSDVSAAVLYLVAKLGPLPRSIRDVSNVYAYLLSRDSTFFRPKQNEPPKNDPMSYYQTEGEYEAFRVRLLELEAWILYCLSFNTHVSLPHPLAVTYLQTLDFLLQPREIIAQAALRYLNAALLSPQMLYLTHQPHALATAAVYNAARDVGAKMPPCEWWEVFDVDREELGFLVVGMRSVEALMRRRREEMPLLMGEGGMVTRSAIEEQMRLRGLHVGNGGDSSKAVDAEDEVMRMMDSR